LPPRAARDRHAVRCCNTSTSHGVVDRLLEEVERTILEGGARRGDIAVCGKHHDRHVDLALTQHGLQLEPPSYGHSQIRSTQPGQSGR